MCINFYSLITLTDIISVLVSFVYVSSIGRVLNQEQYLVKDCGLRGDIIMLVLSLVTLPHLH